MYKKFAQLVPTLVHNRSKISGAFTNLQIENTILLHELLKRVSFVIRVYLKDIIFYTAITLCSSETPHMPYPLHIIND